MSLTVATTFVPFVPGTNSQLKRLIASMTLEEKASMLAGVDDWHFRGIKRLNIPSIRVADCGHGVTLCGDRCSPATCFPTGIGMASTWNTPLLERVGATIGRETRALGCSMLLGPMINLHRIPLNGRSFETFSEDPVLAGQLGAAIIRGIQSTGVAACVKSVTANNQQLHQAQHSVYADERTLRELYLRAFEIAIEQGRPAAVMSAYNALNGELTSESRWLCTTIVKGEWNFSGLIVSDWRAVKSNAVYASGLDLEMPGPGKFLNTRAVLQALEDGELSVEDLDDKVTRIVGVLLQYGQDEQDTSPHTDALDTEENRSLAREVAEESIVLLKNDRNILPLDRSKLKRILVVGPNAAEARLGGGGSASVSAPYSISPLAGIREICGDQVEVQYVEGCSITGTMESLGGDVVHTNDKGETQSGWLAAFYNSGKFEKQPSASWSVPEINFSWGWAAPGPRVLRTNYAVRFVGKVMPSVSGKYTLGAFVQEGSLRLWVDGACVIDGWADESNFEEGYRNQYERVELELVAGRSVDIIFEYAKHAARGAVRLEWQPPGAVNPIDRAVEQAKLADAVIICAGLSNLLEGGARDRETLALPDQQVQLIERIAAVNANTIVTLNNGGPVTMPWESKVPALLEAWYAGQEGGRALANVIFGNVNPSGRLPDTLAHRLEDHASAANYPGDLNRVDYAEKLMVGYRHFDTADITPHYPFGYGLSYTTFVISKPHANASTIANDDDIRIEVSVKNTGQRAGSTVVQVYVRPINAPVDRPIKELKAFAKVRLKPRESENVIFTLRPRDFAYYDTRSNRWTTSAGRYEIMVGEHSRALSGVEVTVVK